MSEATTSRPTTVDPEDATIPAQRPCRTRGKSVVVHVLGVGSKEGVSS